jgi:hypothetical protein
MRARRRRVLSVLACLAVLSCASSAQGAAGLTTGFADGVFSSPDQATRGFWLQRATDARAGMIRVNVGWREIANAQPPADPTNPADPSYNFSAVDRAVQGAAAHGVNVVLTVYSAPAWAEGPGRPDLTTAPAGTWKPDPLALSSFLRALATRYSGGFDPDGPAPGVLLPAARAVQVWNEPNLSQYLTPQYAGAAAISPGQYRAMLNASYSAVKAVAPAMLVVTAGTAPYGDPPGGIRVRPVEFYRQLLCVQPAKKAKKKRKRRKSTRGRSKQGLVEVTGCPAPAKFDVLAHHPINTSGGPRRSAFNPDDASSADLDRIVRVLRAAERFGTVAPGPHPIWATEIWWASNPPNSAGAPIGVHARWIEEALYGLWKDGASVVINLLIRDSTGGPQIASNASQSGLFFADGQPKPAYTAFRFPFVTERIRNGLLRAWGKAPAGGKLVIQRRRRGRWVAVKKIQVRQGSVFIVKLRSPGKPKLRAAVGGSRSLAWRQR